MEHVSLGDFDAMCNNVKVRKGMSGCDDGMWFRWQRLWNVGKRDVMRRENWDDEDFGDADKFNAVEAVGLCTC